MTHPSETNRIALLGTGIMGSALARRLLGAGFATTVWNRSREKAEPLAADGAVVADSPADAAAGADVVITMLTDADVIVEVMGPVLPTLADGTVWAQMSTVGDAGADLLADMAAQHGVAYLDAPVLGTRKPAEDGKLRVLASGPADAIERCRPVFEASGTVFGGLGSAGQGSRLKLAVNTWVLALTDATAAAIALAERFGLDGSLFLDAIDGTPTDSPYAHLKGAAMLGGDAPVGFTVASAAKDAGLIVDAQRRLGMGAAFAEAIRADMAAVVESGGGSDDMAAVVRAHRR